MLVCVYESHPSLAGILSFYGFEEVQKPPLSRHHFTLPFYSKIVLIISSTCIWNHISVIAVSSTLKHNLGNSGREGNTVVISRIFTYCILSSVFISLSGDLVLPFLLLVSVLLGQVC